jgi:hypothetical protein
VPPSLRPNAPRAPGDAGATAGVATLVVVAGVVRPACAEAAVATARGGVTESAGDDRTLLLAMCEITHALTPHTHAARFGLPSRDRRRRLPCADDNDAVDSRPSSLDAEDDDDDDVSESNVDVLDVDDMDCDVDDESSEGASASNLWSSSRTCETICELCVGDGGGENMRRFDSICVRKRVDVRRVTIRARARTHHTSSRTVVVARHRMPLGSMTSTASASCSSSSSSDVPLISAATDTSSGDRTQRDRAHTHQQVVTHVTCATATLSMTSLPSTMTRRRPPPHQSKAPLLLLLSLLSLRLPSSTMTSTRLTSRHSSPSRRCHQWPHSSLACSCCAHVTQRDQQS